MKKALSIILCLSMVMSVFAIVPFNATAAENEITETEATSGTTGDCTWSLDGTVLTISGNGAMEDYWYQDHYYGYYPNSSVVPWEKNITKVTISEGVTNIGDGAFSYCTALTSIDIPNSVTSIGDEAFFECSSLTSITIPDSVSSIGQEVFSGCTALTSVTIPDSVTSIGLDMFEMFYDCTSLTNVSIGNSVTSIGEDAFAYCTSLTSVTIPNSVTSIGEYAFFGCTSLKSVTIPDSVTSIDSYAFGYFYSQNYSLLKLSGFIIYGFTGSAAGKYANRTGFTFKEALGNCSHCGNTLSEENIITDKAVPATCTNTGLTKGTHCPFCGTVFQAQEIIPVKGHTPVTDKAVPATCTEIGLTEGSHCSVCGEVLKAQEVIPATGHKPIIDKAVDATCQHAGHTIGSYCENCGEVYVQSQVIPQLEHSTVTDAAVAATCTKSGLTEGSHCTACGTVFKAQEVIPAKGHTPVTDKAKPATCTEDGLTEGSHCSACGEVFTAQEVIPKLGHKPIIDKAVEATCQHAGHTIGSYCENCGEVFVESQVIPQLPHTPVTDVAVTATCTRTGLTEGSHCSVCGDTIVAQRVINKLPHAAGETVIENDVPVTCATPGSHDEVVYCTVCQNEISRNTVTTKALGHNYEIVSGKPATYLRPGTEDGVKCTRCGEWLIQQEKLPVITSKGIFCDVDSDGEITALDATFVLRSVAKIEIPFVMDEAMGDADGDNQLTVMDATAIQRYLATLSSFYGIGLTLPIEGTDRIFVDSIDLSENDLTINSDQKQRLTSTVSPENADCKKILWFSDDTSVAEVDQSGNVTGTGNVTTTINAIATDGSGAKASCKVTVIVKVRSVTLSSTNLNILKGQSTTLSATVTPSNAANKALQWSSTNPSVATVDQNGKVTTVKAGTATINATATDGSGAKASCKVTVEGIKVSSVTLSSSDLTLSQGQTKSLTATVTPSNADNKSLKWSSSNTSVATVDQSGKVTAVKKGTATIYASATDGSDINGSCTVTVNAIKVSSITLSSSNLNISKGQSKTLTATVAPSNAENKTLQWSSSDSSVATVDQSGKVTALKIGSAKIYATATDGSGVKGSCTITVEGIKVSSITLSSSNLNISKGQSKTLTATVAPSNADNKSLQWSSSNTSVATVDQNGKVTAVKGGTATIYATATDGSGTKGSCAVSVEEINVSDITLSPVSLTMTKGQSKTLSATVSPSNAQNKTLKWVSSNDTVVSVDQSGKVTALKAGTVYITVIATDGSDKRSSCPILVSDPNSANTQLEAYNKVVHYIRTNPTELLYEDEEPCISMYESYGQSGYQLYSISATPWGGLEFHHEYETTKSGLTSTASVSFETNFYNNYTIEPHISFSVRDSVLGYINGFNAEATIDARNYSKNTTLSFSGLSYDDNKTANTAMQLAFSSWRLLLMRKCLTDIKDIGFSSYS